jgi:hypothetical protein
VEALLAVREGTDDSSLGLDTGTVFCSLGAVFLLGHQDLRLSVKSTSPLTPQPVTSTRPFTWQIMSDP